MVKPQTLYYYLLSEVDTLAALQVVESLVFRLLELPVLCETYRQNKLVACHNNGISGSLEF
jgi:hypothetical protein